MSCECRVDVVGLKKSKPEFCLKTIVMTTGQLIKKLRIEKGMTQEELADKTELSARTIQRIEHGEVDPRAYTLQMISIALDVDYDLFIETDSEQEKEFKVEENKTWLALMHLSGLFLLFIPSVIIWNRKKHEIKELSTHYKDIIWFQLSLWIILILPGLFVLLIDGEISIIAIGIFLGGYMTIKNTIKVLNGKPYKYLWTIHFKDENGKTKIRFK